MTAESRVIDHASRPLSAASAINLRSASETYTADASDTSPADAGAPRSRSHADRAWNEAGPRVLRVRPRLPPSDGHASSPALIVRTAEVGKGSGRGSTMNRRNPIRPTNAVTTSATARSASLRRLPSIRRRRACWLLSSTERASISSSSETLTRGCPRRSVRQVQQRNRPTGAGLLQDGHATICGGPVVISLTPGTRSSSGSSPCIEQCARVLLLDHGW